MQKPNWKVMNVKSVRERNADFDKLDAAGKRVAIANDVLTLMEIRVLKARAGTYLSAIIDEFDRRDEGSVLPEETACRACALGSLLFSLENGEAFRRPAHMETHSMYGNYQAAAYHGTFVDLLEYFPLEDLALIEAAFETWGSFQGYWTGEEMSTDKYNSEMRMKYIMQNIVENKGDFNPATIPWLKPSTVTLDAATGKRTYETRASRGMAWALYDKGLISREASEAVEYVTR